MQRNESAHRRRKRYTSFSAALSSLFVCVVEDAESPSPSRIDFAPNPCLMRAYSTAFGSRSRTNWSMASPYSSSLSSPSAQGSLESLAISGNTALSGSVMKCVIVSKWSARRTAAREKSCSLKRVCKTFNTSLPNAGTRSGLNSTRSCTASIICPGAQSWNACAFINDAVAAGNIP